MAVRVCLMLANVGISASLRASKVLLGRFSFCNVGVFVQARRRARGRPESEEEAAGEDSARKWALP
jgi:hypothetical protein